MNKIVTGRASPYIKTGSYEQFEIKYQPNDNCDGSPLKNFVDISKGEDINNMWTVVEGDNRKWYILSGMHIVNRTGYYILCRNARGAGYHRDYLYF